MKRWPKMKETSFRRMLRLGKKTNAEIGEEFGISAEAVASKAYRLGIKNNYKPKVLDGPRPIPKSRSECRATINGKKCANPAVYFQPFCPLCLSSSHRSWKRAESSV